MQKFDFISTDPPKPDWLSTDEWNSIRDDCYGYVLFHIHDRSTKTRGWILGDTFGPYCSLKGCYIMCVAYYPEYGPQKWITKTMYADAVKLVE